MNRDARSLIFATFTLALGVLGMVLTTSWVWPIITLALGGVGLVLALATPAREQQSTPPAPTGGDERMYWQGS